MPGRHLPVFPRLDLASTDLPFRINGSRSLGCMMTGSPDRPLKMALLFSSLPGALQGGDQVLSLEHRASGKRPQPFAAFLLPMDLTPF